MRTFVAAWPDEATRRRLATLELELGHAKNLRLKALRGAYVDALTTACERLEVAPPAGGDRAPLPEIYRVEAALRQRGLDVRETAAR